MHIRPIVAERIDDGSVITHIRNAVSRAEASRQPFTIGMIELLESGSVPTFQKELESRLTFTNGRTVQDIMLQLVPRKEGESRYFLLMHCGVDHVDSEVLGKYLHSLGNQGHWHASYFMQYLPLDGRPIGNYREEAERFYDSFSATFSAAKEAVMRRVPHKAADVADCAK
jgi:hypothetical protein